MREIKFRGKRVDNGKWVYGYYIKYGEKSFIYLNESTRSFLNSFIEVIPETVNQLTGLHDNNGKEIYEGDIYKTIDKTKYEVRFVGGAFCGGALGSDDSMFCPIGWGFEEGDEDWTLDKWLLENAIFIGNIHDKE